MLVSYSDSEGSDNDQPVQSIPKAATKPAAATSNSNFAVDKSTGKIKVSLQSKDDTSVNGTHEDEPAAKRPRLGGSGGGAFSNFNAMLPAPKRDNLPVTQNGAAKMTRKVFSLKTGAEPAFSRESDAELRELFSVQAQDEKGDRSSTDNTIPSVIPKPSFAKPAPPPPASTGKPFMFKPLSVARGTKKKKSAASPAVSNNMPDPSTAGVESSKHPPAQPTNVSEPSKKKMSLFSSDTAPESSGGWNSANTHDVDGDEIIEDLGPVPPEAQEDSLDSFLAPQSEHQQQTTSSNHHQDLSSIANDLNLSAAERRQLMGRSKNKQHQGAVNVINFNTDSEYAANQQLIASGEQQQHQHNPVRAISSGKHSLRQLVSSAANQKDALEESFASGRRNKKEAGNKYGW